MKVVVGVALELEIHANSGVVAGGVGGSSPRGLCAPCPAPTSRRLHDVGAFPHESDSKCRYMLGGQLVQVALHVSAPTTPSACR